MGTRYGLPFWRFWTKVTVMKSIFNVSVARSDQRRHQRVETESNVWVKNSGRDSSEDTAFAVGLRCQLVDLSFGGAKMIAAVGLGGVGDRIELRLPTACGDIVPFTGEILRTETYRSAHVTAVRFDTLSSTQHVRLSEVLKSLTENFSLLIRTRPLPAAPNCGSPIA